MSLLVLDDQGRLWPGESRQLREAFDSPYSGGEFIEYAVKNLGFIAINAYGSSCQLRMRPRFVTRRALESLAAWWRRTKNDRVVLTVFDGEWKDEFVLARKFDERLEKLFLEGERERPSDFLNRQIKADTLRRKPLLADIFETWPHLVSSYEADVLMRLLRSAFDDRYVLVRRQEEQDRLYFKEFGDRMFPHYETWRQCAVGAPIEEQPDRAYGRWVAQTYRGSMATNEAKLEAVDTIVRCPVRGPTRLRYMRMILPLGESSSGNVFFGGSFDDSTVDLRIPSR